MPVNRQATGQRIPSSFRVLRAPERLCREVGMTTISHEGVKTSQAPGSTSTHASRRIAALRSVALNVPDLQQAEAFYTEVWGLRVVARTEQAIYFGATGGDHHVLALHASDGPLSIRNVTLRAHTREALEAVAASALEAGGSVLASPHVVAEPGGGVAVLVADTDGRIFRVVHGDQVAAPQAAEADRPIRLAHAVLNAADIDKAQAFLEQVLDFSRSDRTRIMAFMRCNDDHHSLALGDTDNNALNHIAFLMPGLDDVMRGGGRMRDHGYGIEWGPGRHGPGDNAFNYFIGPFGEVIEYTAEVEQIDDGYHSGMPDDWKWPPGRIDQWGIGIGPTDSLKQAQRAVLFVSQDAVRAEAEASPGVAR